MNKGIKSLQATLVILMGAAMSFYGLWQQPVADNRINIAQTAAPTDNSAVRLSLWYSDEDMKPYLDYLCDEYFESSGVHVIPTFVESSSYLDTVIEAGDEAPDLFITDNYNLELATLSGIAGIVEKGKIQLDENDKAMDAVTYKGNAMAYPLYFDTSFLASNSTYIRTFAKDQIEAQRAQEAADSAESGQEPTETVAASEEEIDSKVSEYMPKLFTDLENFADTYDAPENVTSILLWDAEDIFYNYFILGSTIDLGGKYGDDENTLSVRGKDSVVAMKTYKELMDFFSLGEDEHPYSQVREAFANGELVFAIASTDIIKTIADKKAGGEISWDYDVHQIPNISETIEAKPLSVTGCICIGNNNPKAAGDFAVYATAPERAKLLFDMTGKISTAKDAQSYITEDEELAEKIKAAKDCFQKSSPAIKIMSRTDYWMKLEIALEKVEKGADIQIILQNLEAGL